MPSVSVIIPSFNRAGYIAKTLQSALGQSYKDKEIIVIDDGSTDNTYEAIRPYLDKIIYYKNKTNGGPPVARNLGLKLAKGRYIAFLDSDDLWLPGKLDIQVEYLDRNEEIGLLFTDMEIFQEDDKGHKIIVETVRLENNDLSFASLFRCNFIPTLTVMFRRECIEKVGLFDESMEIAEDYEMWLRIRRFYEFGHIPRVLAKYRLHEGNIVGKDREKALHWNIITIKKILERYPEIEKELVMDMRKYFMYLFYSSGIENYKNGQYRLAVRKFFKGVSYKPFCLAGYYYCINSILASTQSLKNSKGIISE